VDNTKDILYPIGTLVRVNKLNTPSGVVDVSGDSLIGYVTEYYRASYTPRIYYVVKLFSSLSEHSVFEWYLSPVSEST
jgi:hypothetical protein